MKLAQLFGKNQLDEMQERTMLTIESRGFWLVWSLLLVVLLGEGLLGFTMREMAGTWAVFMIGCVYIVVACLPACRALEPEHQSYHRRKFGRQSYFWRCGWRVRLYQNVSL